MNERGHTRNPVPFIAFGPKEVEIRERVKSLTDVTPAILDFI
jgi:bisphosphoglycerate-independent phosphoglycerate mutase (AlkP superfamily)